MHVSFFEKVWSSSSIARRRVLAAATLAAIWVAPVTSSAGPVMLAGHDADDHGFEAVYAGLFDELLANVTNGNSGILAIGADSGTTAGNWIESVAAQMTVPQTVTFVNDAAITTQDFSTFALIHVPSTEVDLPDGGITLAENSLLAARALDISDFINDGGGLFGLTQDSVADAYDYLGLFGAIVATPVPASGVCDGTGSGGENYDNITSTAGGATLGITDTNIDGCCWHNSFESFAPFFQILAIVDEPGCSDIDTDAAVIGCLQCSLPGQKSLSPALSTGLPGTGHTVTATLLESVAPNDPVPGILVTFDVISGPNSGTSGTDTTNAAGEAVFSYTGGATPGVDVITSTCTDPVTLDTIDSNEARRFWDLDCNSNGIADTCDIDCAGFAGECGTFGTCGESADANSNGIPDECAICGNSILEPGEDCDDGNTSAGDCCAADCTFESAGSSCADGAVCNGDETCDGAGTCGAGTDVDCSHLDVGCFTGTCTEPTGNCETVVSADGAPCDDGNACTILDVCNAGICAGESPCGNGSVEASCGEECDPPDGTTCDPTCQNVECGDASVQVGEECDDGNVANGDGCSSTCQFEEKFCIIGESPAVARVAKRVAFVSDEDYVGANADGNNEIFFFDKKVLDKVIKKAVRKGEDAQTVATTELTNNPAKYFSQLTDTTGPVINEMPTINGNGRVVGYVSTSDPLGTNADGSREIFRLDRKRFAKGEPTGFLQITDGVGTSSLHPNLRAAKGALMIYDSDSNLAPDRCVGGKNNLQPCTSAGDCPDGACGNPEGNREVFAFILKAFRSGGIGTRQVTASVSGLSEVGQSVNFSTAATAFSSTADLLGTNPEGNAEIFQVTKDFDSLSQLTTAPSGSSFAPAQSKRRRVAFASTGDFTGANPDANAEIFLWSLKGSPPIEQPFMSGGCSNDAPSIDARGRFLAFHSTCDLIPSSGNPDQSIFIWDTKAGALLPLVVRGPTSSASARPQATKKVRVLTFEGNLGSEDPAICFLNARDELLEILSP